MITLELFTKNVKKDFRTIMDTEEKGGGRGEHFTNANVDIMYSEIWSKLQSVDLVLQRRINKLGMYSRFYIC